LKLLFDENLSPRLALAVSDIFPGSRHIEDCGLLAATDEEVWLYKRTHGFAIVTKDSDFADMSRLFGSPPKIVWLRIGNSTTSRVEFMLINLASRIQDFLIRGTDHCLILGRPR